jgi:prolyl oligopeptidase
MRRSIVSALSVLSVLSGLCAASLIAGVAVAADDPYLWLEQPQAQRALEWAKAQSQQTKAELSARSEYAAISAELKDALSAAPPAPSYWLLNDKVLRLSRDVAHPHDLIEVAARGPDGAARPWRVALDMEKLRAVEGKPYVLQLHGVGFQQNCLSPAYDRCLLPLSLAGSDDVELREFDLNAGAFVAEGFRLGAGHASFAWAIATIFSIVSTQFGDPRTAAGFSSAVRVWTRGQAPDAAAVVWRGEPTDQYEQLSAIGDGASRQGVIDRVLGLFDHEILPGRDRREGASGGLARAHQAGRLACEHRPSPDIPDPRGGDNWGRIYRG